MCWVFMRVIGTVKVLSFTRAGNLREVWLHLIKDHLIMHVSFHLESWTSSLPRRRAPTNTPSRSAANNASVRSSAGTINLERVTCFSLEGQMGQYIQENYNTPLEHTPGNPPSQLWKERFRGVFQRCVEITFEYSNCKREGTSKT